MSILDAVALAFTLFYVLWLEYPATVVCTWQFIQRKIFMKELKSDGRAPTKLHSFVTNLQAFES